MHKLNDRIHHCDTCDIYPCTKREEVISPVCSNCPTSCCKHELIVLMPCEEDHFEKGMYGGLKSENGWCHYHTSTGCSVFETRPIICRISECESVRKGYIINERENL